MALGRKTGGRRKGYKAPQTLSKEAAREYLRQRVIADLGPLYEAQAANAKGLKYLIARDRTTGKFRRLTEEGLQAMEAGEEDREIIEVWEKDPNVSAFTDLMNRALDKPKEQEQALNIQGALEIKWQS